MTYLLMIICRFVSAIDMMSSFRWILDCLAASVVANPLVVEIALLTVLLVDAIAGAIVDAIALLIVWLADEITGAIVDTIELLTVLLEDAIACAEVDAVALLTVWPDDAIAGAIVGGIPTGRTLIVGGNNRLVGAITTGAGRTLLLDGVNTVSSMISISLSLKSSSYDLKKNCFTSLTKLK